MGRRQQSSRQVLLASLPSPGACGLGRQPSRNRAAGLSTSCQAQPVGSPHSSDQHSPLLTAEEARSLGCLQRGCSAAGPPYKPNSPTTNRSERLACGCVRPAPYSAPSHTRETERGPWTPAPCAWEECAEPSCPRLGGRRPCAFLHAAPAMSHLPLACVTLLGSGFFTKSAV